VCAGSAVATMQIDTMPLVDAFFFNIKSTSKGYEDCMDSDDGRPNQILRNSSKKCYTYPSMLGGVRDGHADMYQTWKF
jgi:hypothetical protein